MIVLSRLMLAGICLCIFPALATAGPCDALFRFDGNLNDSGGNGYNGQMIGPKGAPATPQFVAGKFGQALRLDGSSAMRTFIDLHPDGCPQVTLTAWVRIEGEGDKQTQFIVSTGSYRGPGMYVAGTNLTQAGSGNGQYQADAIRAGANWTFVAASYDNVARKYRLHWRTRSKEMAMGSTSPPEEALWIGAFDDNLGHPAKNVVLDDVQIIGRVLSHEEFLAMQESPAVTAAVSTTGSVLAKDSGVKAGPVVSGVVSCASNDECPAQSYCAVDSTCHPDSHAPRSSGGGLTVDEWNEQ